MLSLWLTVSFLSYTFACSCDQQWQRNPDDGILNIYINRTLSGQYEMLTWQWMTLLNDGIWTVTLKRWPKIDYTTGTLKFKNSITSTVSHVGWKIKRNILTWSKNHGMIIQPAWNMSVCNFNMDWGFKPAPDGHWSFRIGNITMSGDVGSKTIEQITKSKYAKKRTKRAPEDEVEEIPLDEGSEGESEKPSFVKWLLKTTGLEQGDGTDSWHKKIVDLLTFWLTFLASQMY